MREILKITENIPLEIGDKVQLRKDASESLLQAFEPHITKDTIMTIVGITEPSQELIENEKTGELFTEQWPALASVEIFGVTKTYSIALAHLTRLLN